MSAGRDRRRRTVPGPVLRLALVAIAGLSLLALLATPGSSGLDGRPPDTVATDIHGQTGLAVPAGRAARDVSTPDPEAGATDPRAGESRRAGAVAGRRARRSLDPALDAPPAPVPEVVRFRPRGGWTGVEPTANLSVRFTVPMDHASTERAFSATVAGGDRVTGRLGWAEGDTVLVLDPARSLPDGTRVRLEVSTDARSADGIPLEAGASATFAVRSRPAATPAAASDGWRWPLRGPITQRFGQSLTKYGVHQGLDIDGDTGDPVRAAQAGRVVVAGHYDDCGGLEVHIDHGGGVVSWYRHLSRIDIAVGTRVTAGTVIGRVGNTGCSLGSHLHFAIRVGRTFVDPLPYLPPR